MVRRGCKRSFGPREQEASCTGAKWGCTRAREGLGGARDSWETFAPWAQKRQIEAHLAILLKTTFRGWPSRGSNSQGKKNGTLHALNQRRKPLSIGTWPQWPPEAESSIAIEDAVENRGLCHFFCFALVLKGLETLAPLSRG